ncbi:DNA polymerase beta superfamily protein [Cellulomonas sp. P5_C5]
MDDPKKLFHSVRPALAVRWLGQLPDAALPPMTLGDVAAQTVLTAGQCDAIDDLVALKAVTQETGSGAMPAVLS